MKKIHRVLELDQSKWLNPYIEFNTHTKKKKTEKNDDNDGKVFCKLMNNAVYGKTMENLRNRVAVKLVNGEKDFLKWTSKSNYAAQKNI